MTAELDVAPTGAEVGREGVEVPLVTDSGSVALRIPPAGRWKTRATRALKEGDFDAWAEGALSPDDYSAWLEADPVNDDVNQFFAAWQERLNEDAPAKQPANRRSRR